MKFFSLKVRHGDSDSDSGSDCDSMLFDHIFHKYIYAELFKMWCIILIIGLRIKIKT